MSRIGLGLIVPFALAGLTYAGEGGGEQLRRFDVAYCAAGVDDAETNRKFAESLELDYPILSDPTKKTAADFGVLAYEGKYAARHTFYIDREVKPATAGADTIARLEALGIKSRE